MQARGSTRDVLLLGNGDEIAEMSEFHDSREDT
jgi:hypothetical protein